MPLGNVSDLSYFGKSLREVFENANIKVDEDTFKDSTASLWTTKLFPLAATMSQSFFYTVKQTDALKAGSKCPISSNHRVSMADIMEMKDVSTMLEHRNKLTSLITM